MTWKGARDDTATKHAVVLNLTASISAPTLQSKIHIAQQPAKYRPKAADVSGWRCDKATLTTIKEMAGKRAPRSRDDLDSLGIGPGFCLMTMDYEPSASRLAAGCLNTLLLLLSVGLFWTGAGSWIRSCNVSECTGHASDIVRHMAKDAVLYEIENHFEESVLGVVLVCTILICALSNALTIVFNAGSAAVCASCSLLRRVMTNPYGVGTITFLLLGVAQLYLWSHRATVVYSPSLDCTIRCSDRGGRSHGAMAAAAALSVCVGAVNAAIWACRYN